MRQLVIDAARKEGAGKRGGGQVYSSLEEAAEPVDREPAGRVNVLELDEALTRLAATHPELADLVQLHHFGGWELKQIAQDVLGISYKEAKTRWQLAKAWLRRELQE